MAVIRSGATADELTIDPTSKAARVTLYDAAGVAVPQGNATPTPIVAKPLPYGALGHYRTTFRLTLIAALAANARLFELRNTHATNLIVPTRLIVKLYQVAAGTAQMAGLDMFRATAFTAVDTTNTVTPTPTVKRTSMAAAPGGAAIRQSTSNTAGMTGGTLTKAADPCWAQTYAVAAAAGTTNAAQWGPYDVFDDINGTHPFVFIQNEGFEIENRSLNSTTNGIELAVDFSWAEVTSF